MSDDIVRIFVPGIPQPGGSKKGFVYFDKEQQKHRAALTEDNKKSKPWRDAVAWEAKAACREPLRGPVAVEFLFFLPRPKGHYGTGRNAGILKSSSPVHPTVKPDVTKLIRSTEDAMKGIAWIDDSDVVDQHGRKVYGRRPGALITITLAHGAYDDERRLEELLGGQMWINGLGQ